MDKKEQEKKEKDEKEDISAEDLQKQLEECQKLKDEYLAGWQRARADFLNYKKEELERMEGLIQYANIELILKILPILDNFELAEKTMKDNLKRDESVKGLLQIKNQLQDLLKNHGIDEIKSIGEKFDPNLHEAVEEVEPSTAKAMTGKEIESGVVVEELQKGYKIDGQLLRPAKVRITK